MAQQTNSPLTPEIAESLSNALAVWNMFLEQNKSRFAPGDYEKDKARWLAASQWLQHNDPAPAQ